MSEYGSRLEREAALRRALLAHQPKHAEVGDAHWAAERRTAIAARIHEAAAAATTPEEE